MKVRTVLFGIALLTVLIVGTGFAQQATTTHALDQQPILRMASQPSTSPGTSASMKNDDPGHALAQQPTLRTKWEPGKSEPTKGGHH